MSETTVVLGIADPGLQEEVLDFLDRCPRVRVVGTASRPPELAHTIGERHPDVAVSSPEVLGPDLDGAAVFVVDQKESTAALRAAVRAGARGFYVWPGERDALGRDVVRVSHRPDQAAGSGRIVAVVGARGGAGATFVATSLAAACASNGARTALVDLDTFYRDVTSALGIADGGPARTSADLGPVLDEITTGHLDKVLHDHPRGFRALLASADVRPDDLTPAFGPLRSSFDAVILHVPRAITETRRRFSRPTRSSWSSPSTSSPFGPPGESSRSSSPSEYVTGCGSS